MGNEGRTTIITLTRTGDISGLSTATVSTSGGTATGGASCSSGVDYISVSQTYAFSPGIATLPFNMTLCPDVVVDPFETVNLTLSAPTGVALGAQSTAVLTINDTANQFLNANRETIVINSGAAASPYPSTINVTGAPSGNVNVRVTLYDLAVNFPDNLDVLLVSPGGAKYVLMADVGGSTPINQNAPVTLTFTDASAAVLPDNGPLTTGAFKPTSCQTPVSNFPAPAPGGAYIEPGCTVASANTHPLNGSLGAANGIWSLYIRDDTGTLAPTAVVGQIAGGWGIEVTGATTAAGAQVSGRVLTPDGSGLRNALVTMIDANGIARTVKTTSFGYYTFEDVESGGSYIIGVSSKRYHFASRLIQVADTLTDLDFVGLE